MNKKTLKLFVCFTLIISFFFWYWRHHKSNNTVLEPTLSSTESPALQGTPTLPKKASSPEPLPTYQDTTEKQKEFTTRIKDLNEIILGCQKEVERLFPVQSLDEPSKTYRDINQFKEALQKFYQVVSKKMEKSAELISFLESLSENDLTPERIFNQLSSIEDCGDFEEEAILDQAINTAKESNWSLDQKKELATTILQNFKGQMNQSLGLHQLTSKIDILKSLIEDGILPNKLKTDMASMEQAIEAAEQEFRQGMPADFAEKRYPPLQDILDIKNMEKEIVEKLKPQFSDVLSNCEGAL